jgi:hypothetical protein
MPNQRNAPRPSRPRVVRRYRTCAEALQAVYALEALAEDEVSYLREQGREAEADRRADAWSREIARALGEAEALRRALETDPEESSCGQPSKLGGYLTLWARRPARGLALTAAFLVVLVGAARLVEAITPELLTVATVALLFAALLSRAQTRRGGGGRGR